MTTQRSGSRTRKAIAATATMLLISAFTIAAQAAGRHTGGGPLRLEAERMETRTVGGPDGPAWNLWSEGSIGTSFDVEDPGTYEVVIRARGNSDTGRRPRMELRIDDRAVASWAVDTVDHRFDEHRVEVDLTAGTHRLAVAFTNDPNRPGHNLDLVVDWVEIVAADGGDDPSVPDPSVPDPSPPIPGPPLPSLPAPPLPEPSMPAPPGPPTTTPTTPTTTAPTTTPTTPTTTAPTTPTTATPERPPDTGRSPHVPAGYELSWHDEFDRLSLDLATDGSANWVTYFHRWNVRSLAGNGDQCLKADPDFVGTGGPPLGVETHRVTGGVLTLFGHPLPQHRRSQFWGFEAACGMISGELSHSQTYGYWETRMRVTNVSLGHHWAIWLLPEDGSWPPEVDLFEVVGTTTAGGRNNDRARFHFTGHYNDASGAHRTEMSYLQAPRGADGWYTLGVEWTADSVVWYLDGQEVHRMWNFIGTAPVYFLISPEIGGNWPGPTGPATTWPMSMEVDYVRIYQR